MQNSNRSSRSIRTAVLLVGLAAGVACAGGPDGGESSSPAARSALPREGIEKAVETVQAAALSRWVQELSDDRMEGRLPGTPGEEKAIAWVEAAFREAHLTPVEGDSYFQEVPLVGITADPSMSLRVEGRGTGRSLVYGEEFMGGTTREQERIDASGELVFVGYGTEAPEFDWDDYKGFDARGKVLIMLVTDPPLADEARFGGKTMTYYGRWTYKYEVGAAKGAAGVILVHQTEAAGYPWAVVANSWAGEQFVPSRADAGASRLPFESWVTHEIAEELFTLAGLDLAEMEKQAATEAFEPLPLGLEASLSFTNTIRRVQSHNVAGLRRGTDLADQWVIYTAHWDHLGIGNEVDGDDIYNGAFDNATGVAGLIGIARAFDALAEPPRRSILFLAVTAEEQGLIGSYHYADNPLHPLASTAAVINMDGMNVHGRTKDVIVIGLGNTTLDDLVTTAAQEQGRYVRPDMEPEKGFYYRSDQFPFAKKGVPALYIDHGIDYVGRPEGWGMEQNARYTAENYHKPSDEFDSSWDFSGMIDDARLLFRVGLMAAQADRMPEWKAGTEFKAIRERSLASAASP